MFLHLKTFDKQISLHSKDKVEAVPEVKDEEGNVTQAKVESAPAEPLKNVIKSAMGHWGQDVSTDTWAVIVNDKRLDIYKTPEENGLKDNDLVTVVTQKSLDDDVMEKAAALEKAKKLAGKF